MPASNPIISWAPKVPQAKIQRLYTADSAGLADEELADAVGWALWSRCDAILTVTEAHYGRLHCPLCSSLIENSRPWKNEDQVVCPGCGWQIPWPAYHQTYKGKQLFGANAVEVFAVFHRAFPSASEYSQKMLLIDQLIHGFHTGLTELGRPVGANLIQGSLKEVIQFLDQLTNGDASATRLGDSRGEWRRNLESASWSKGFLT